MKSTTPTRRTFNHPQCGTQSMLTSTTFPAASTAAVPVLDLAFTTRVSSYCKSLSIKQSRVHVHNHGGGRDWSDMRLSQVCGLHFRGTNFAGVYRLTCMYWSLSATNSEVSKNETSQVFLNAGNRYDLLNFNCNHFASRFAEMLQMKENFPQKVFTVTNLLDNLRCCLPRCILSGRLDWFRSKPQNEDNEQRLMEL